MANSFERALPDDALQLHTDVLVIGGGMAGAWAAAAAAQKGAKVILVDKGYCGTSGVTATAGPGHWWVPPDPPEARPNAIAARNKTAFGLGDPGWMASVIDLTWRVLPTLAKYYDFSRNEEGVIQYRGLRGPEYLRALRNLITDLGVVILDHHPALELVRAGDGVIAGARGVRRQHANQPWEITAGAVVLATGGTSFRSHLLGAFNNTGDGYLMGAEAGATLSGLEFTAAYTVAPARTTMTRTMSYAYASYYGADGKLLDVPGGPNNLVPLARAMLGGPVFCRFDRMPDMIRQWLPTISPNVMLPFDRDGIDPWRDKFEVTLHNDGTIRGTGGLRIVDGDCGVGVPGLYAAGDAASRELIAGATSGGGAQNSAWALSSAHWAAIAAADFAKSRSTVKPLVEGIGQAGIRPAQSAKEIDSNAAIKAVQAEMHPLDRNLFRRGDRLTRSAIALESLWSEIRDHAGVIRAGGEDGFNVDPLRLREAAALTATARWSVAASLQRAESRGLHIREDYAASDESLAHRLEVGGFDAIFVRADKTGPRTPDASIAESLASESHKVRDEPEFNEKLKKKHDDRSCIQ